MRTPRASHLLAIAGALLVAFGIFSFATAPAAQPMPDDSGFMEGHKSIDQISRDGREWIESVGDHNAAMSRGYGACAFGALLLFGSFVFSRRGRAMQFQVVEQVSAAQGRGFARGFAAGDPANGAAARLTHLSELRGKGLLTEDEYEQKRRAIVSEL